MNKITPINFKANYQPIKKTTNVVKNELPKISTNIDKKSPETKSILKKLLAVTGISAFLAKRKEQKLNEARQEANEILYNKLKNQTISYGYSEKKVPLYSEQAIQEIIKETNADEAKGKALKKYLRESYRVRDAVLIAAVDIFRENPEYANDLKGSDSYNGLEDVVYKDKILKAPDNIKNILETYLKKNKWYSLEQKAFAIDCIKEFPQLVENKNLLNAFFNMLSYSTPCEYSSHWSKYYKYYEPAYNIHNYAQVDSSKEIYSEDLRWQKDILKEALSRIDDVNKYLEEFDYDTLYACVTLLDDFINSKEAFDIARKMFYMEPVNIKLGVKAINAGGLDELKAYYNSIENIHNNPVLPDDRIPYTDKLAFRVDQITGNVKEWRVYGPRIEDDYPNLNNIVKAIIDLEARKKKS